MARVSFPAGQAVKPNSHFLEIEKALCPNGDLRGANLAGLDLRGADLTGLDLRGTNFAGSNTAGANFTGATF